MAQNTVKPEKTGFGMAITARPRPVFCVFGVKKLRTFYFKLTEQSSRKKLAAGGFEPKKVQPPYPATQKKLATLCNKINKEKTQVLLPYDQKTASILKNENCIRV